MSLDVYLISKDKHPRKESSGIFIRENGHMVEISEEEWSKRFPGRTPVRVLSHEDETNELYSANITHNLGGMATAAHVYYACWRPEERGWKQAKDLIKPLERGLSRLEGDPAKFKTFDPNNGWGSYEGLVEFVKDYLEACKKYPEAEIEVSR